MIPDNSEFYKLIDKITSDPEYRKALWAKIMPEPKRVLEGKEKENVLLLLKLTKPVIESNDQRCWYEKYIIGKKIYSVTYGIEEEPIVEEHLNETNL